MGFASSGRITSFLRTAQCIYSDNRKQFDVEGGQEWSLEKQRKLNSEYMMKYCQCDRCIQKRKERERLIKALQRDGAPESLIKKIG